MKSCLLILLAFQCSISLIETAIVAVNTTDSNVKNSSIPTSEVISIKSAPWQVSVRVKTYEQQFFGNGHICGGSVISQRVVLSGAICILNETFYYRKPDEFILVMGSDSLNAISPNTLQYNIQQIAIHLAFNYQTLNNNVALFLIDGFIPWNWPTVKAIPLNTDDKLMGLACVTSGWNMTNTETSNNLLATQLPIINGTVCTSVYGEMTSDLICAGYTQNATHDFCEGDAGGPLVCSGHLTGIILEGNSCAKTGYPGLYVNILYHYNWIVANNHSFNYNRYLESHDMLNIGDVKLSSAKSASDANLKFFGNLTLLILLLSLRIF